jgi:predicted SPOUT superfamily RNA methylase MTH1
MKDIGKIAVPLQIIFNKSLLQCKYSTSWKIAHVIAIFKKGYVLLLSVVDLAGN